MNYFNLEEILKRKNNVRHFVITDYLDSDDIYVRPCRRLIVVIKTSGDCKVFTREELCQDLGLIDWSFKALVSSRRFKRKYEVFAYEDQLYEWANGRFNF